MRRISVRLTRSPDAHHRSDGILTSQSYNASNDVVSQTGHPRQRDALSLLLRRFVRQTIAGPHVTNYYYDAAARLTGMLDFGFSMASRTISTMRLIKPTITTDPLRQHHGKTSTMQPATSSARLTPTHTSSYALYDPLNRATVTIDRLGYRTTTIYDAVGNATTVI